MAVNTDHVGQMPIHQFETYMRKQRIKFIPTENIYNILDVGGGDGEVWVLSPQRASIDLVEPDKNLRLVAGASGVYDYLFESIEDASSASLNYDLTTILGVLEHLDDPKDFLNQVAEIINTKYIYITVPNALSFHRLMGVELGLLSDPYELHEGDLSIGHKRVWGFGEFMEFIHKFNDLSVVSYGTIGFKPASYSQLAQIQSEKEFAAMCDVAYATGISGRMAPFGAENYCLLEVK